ncbi:MAG: GWxTD domain-containing protein [Bacteroidota bacterium]|nr:GWxTD domain-containing protein [Bacteroidota bacterium]
MKYLFRFVAAVVCLSSALEAENVSSLHVSVDMGEYRGDSTSAYVEVYYSFDVTHLKFVKKDSTYLSQAVIRAYFKNSATDSIVAAQAFRIPFSVNDTSVLGSSRYYVDVLGFLLKPDVYRLYFAATDGNDANRGDSISFPIEIHPVEGRHLTESDLELCSSIIEKEKEANDRFYKNTLEVKPNPSRLYGDGQPVLFYYTELYNLLTNRSKNYYTKISVVNSLGNEVISQERTKQRVHESSVEVGTINVNKLRTGAYTLTFSATDSIDATVASASKRFFVYNSSLPMEDVSSGAGGSVMGSEYAAMSENELDNEFNEARYIATRDEIGQYSKLKGADAKRKMLYEFWKKRDPDPSTSVNEEKVEYMKRLTYVNEAYKTAYKPGWKTDRGRVYIVYGPPDEVDRHANEIDMKPYEIWRYNSIQGGVEFDFGDRTGFSDYILLNSTDRDELHDDSWMDQLRAQ